MRMIQYDVTFVICREVSAYWVPAFAGHDSYAFRASNAIRSAKPASTVPISQRCTKSQVGRVPRKPAIDPAALQAAFGWSARLGFGILRAKGVVAYKCAASKRNINL